jgi:hypothetical protein
MAAGVNLPVFVVDGSGRRHRPRRPSGAVARGGRVVSTPQDLTVSNDPDFEAKQNRILEL